MEVELKDFGIPSVAAVSASLGALWGLIVGLLLVFVGGVTVPSLVPFAAGVLGTVIAIVLFALIGLVVGVMSAFLYNIITKFTGGVKIRLEMMEEE